MSGMSQRTSDAQKMSENVRMLIDGGAQQLHAVFIHIGFDRSGRARQSTLHAFRHAIELADERNLNAVIVVHAVERPDFKGLTEAFRTVAGQSNFAMPERVFVLNLVVRNIPDEYSSQRPLNAVRAEQEGFSEFTYGANRERFQIFMLAVLSYFLHQPMQLQRNNEYCRRGCGNEGDSRTFNRRCHGYMAPAHPPNCSYEPEDTSRHHSGELGEPLHCDVVDGSTKTFMPGGYAAVGANLPDAMKTARRAANTAVPLANQTVFKNEKTIGALAKAHRTYVGTGPRRLVPLGRAKSITDMVSEFGQHAQLVIKKPGIDTIPDLIKSPPTGTDEVVASVLGNATVWDNLKGTASRVSAIVGPITNTLLVLEAADQAVGWANYGSWPCCNAAKLSAKGCARQWSCCGRYQSAATGPVGCGRLSCKACHGLWNEDPAQGAFEVKCSICGDYVGVVPANCEEDFAEADPPHGPCRNLQDDEGHDVGRRTDESHGQPDLEALRNHRTAALGGGSS